MHKVSDSCFPHTCRRWREVSRPLTDETPNKGIVLSSRALGQNEHQHSSCADKLTDQRPHKGRARARPKGKLIWVEAGK